MKGYSVGIDFGTSNIKVSYFNKARNRSDPLKIDKNDGSADKKVPNVILYKDREQTNMGRIAVRAKVLQRQNVVELIKRKLELEQWSQNFTKLGFTLNAEEVTVDIFRWVKERIEEQGKELEHAVITVPVCFTELQKGKILRAAKEAGIPVSGTITEPVAALFSINELFEEGPGEGKARNVVVFDFGGSTLDLCLCRVTYEEDRIEIQVEASCGARLGGVDLTQMIYEDIIYPKYQREIDEEIAQDNIHRVEQEFFDFTDELKMALFSEETEKVEDYFNLPYSSQSLPMTLTLEETVRCFQSRKVAETICRAIDSLFEDSSVLDKEDIDMVKTFGGTSRVLFIRQILADYFGSDTYDIDDYDEDEAYSAVADGAARYLNLLENTDNQVTVKNTIPFYVGVDQNGCFRSVVQRNAKYGVFSPSRNLNAIVRPDGEWRIPLYQSFDREQISITGEKGAVYLGSVVLDQEKYQEFDRIQYKFGVDGSGRIVGRFYEVDTDNVLLLREEKEILIGG